MGGARVIISIANHDPTIVYDLKRNKSPNTKPINPETESQIQLCRLASIGNAMPRINRLSKVRKINPKQRRIKLTGKEPTFLLADSKLRAVIVQKIATNKAKISP